MEIALIHDWLNGMRGGENVLEAFSQKFPKADIFTLFCDNDKISDKLKKHKITTSFIQDLPKREKHYRFYLPLFPRAIEKFNVADYDVLLSSSHCVAKGILPGSESLHICYCHSPMRYVWDRFDDYFPEKETGYLKYQIIKYLTSRLREWDKKTAYRVDLFLANSNFVKQRIEKYYNRPAKVVFPPVDTEFYTPKKENDGAYFLLAGAMVPYKKSDIVIEAFRSIKEKLVVVGDGPDFIKLVNIAPKNVIFKGWVDRDSLREYYRGCKALIFPGVEDFGIIPVEAQACGKPVIAYGYGGLLDSVIDPEFNGNNSGHRKRTGLFFNEQTPQAIINAVNKFNDLEFNHDDIRENSERFSSIRFFKEIDAILEEAIGIFRKQGKETIESRIANAD